MGRRSDQSYLTLIVLYGIIKTGRSFRGLQTRRDIMNNEWTKLEDRQLQQLQVPTARGRALALLNEDGEVIAAGQLLMRGPDNHWLIEPVYGYPQYVQGFPADGGIVPQQLTENFLQYAPRAERLKVADLLISNLPPAEGLGDFETFVKCDRCQGYNVRRIFVGAEDKFPTDSNMRCVNLGRAEGVIAFLRPEHGICACM